MHILEKFKLYSVPELSGILGYENNWIYQNLHQIPVVRLGRTLRLTRFDIETFIRSIYSGNIDDALSSHLNSRVPQIPREARILDITQVADMFGSQRGFVLKCIHELGCPDITQIGLAMSR